MEEIDSEVGYEAPQLETSDQPTRPIVPSPPAAPSFVYALGQIQSRFPSLAVEKEFAQVTGRAGAAGLTDHEAVHAVLSDRANRYLARQLCWVFTIAGLETYLLTPHDLVDLDLLVESVRPRPNPTDLDGVIGILGPLAPPEACGGVVVPVVAFDVLYSFDRDSLLDAIPVPEKSTRAQQERLRSTSSELLDRILQLVDNAGATDEHRALNYLAVRYPAIYMQTAAAHAENSSLTAVDVRPSWLSGVRTILDVIFSYTHRETDVTEKYFVRVDVTEEFPFLVTKLSPYYDR